MCLVYDIKYICGHSRTTSRWLQCDLFRATYDCPGDRVIVLPSANDCHACREPPPKKEEKDSRSLLERLFGKRDADYKAEKNRERIWADTEEAAIGEVSEEPLLGPHEKPPA